MPYEVTIDRDECMSAGKCVIAAPAFFAFDGDELVSLIPDGEMPDDSTMLRIARQCPSSAIRLRLDGEDVEL